ncbi:hypothetical protein DBR32_04960 [Taibaiella sp. KBW10]|uniref:WbqC family protein n=1 Tax=Taibaiella sp. KBW10 TaxID=2153357 RepID=UPI000F5A7475|nr:WbqC family protein [Taibaiella sp. KBW10]RQO31316.1 hypothetical protein DBR32_04960 [Taibaiella sp. KBW10]
MTKTYTQVVASALPFPPVSWWQKVLKAKTLILDTQEHYQKMSYRNRYYLADKKGKSILSIPLTNGRNQRIPMNAVGISYAEHWQKTHWRTLQTLLGNAPFFEYIDYQLFPFFEKEVPLLSDWNLATIIWANHFLGNPVAISTSEAYIPEYDQDTLDLRTSTHPKDEAYIGAPYYQVFSEESGFLSDCSILDLICCEGKNAINFLR